MNRSGARQVPVTVEPNSGARHGRSVRTLLVLPTLLLAASCVSAPRTPVASPPRVVAPPAPAAPIARPTDWRDWPQTPGDWHYRPGPGGSVASFDAGAAPLVSLRCDPASRTITLALGEGAAAAAATVRTTSVTRLVALTPGVGARFAAQDPLLDAIGFSRGRFVVEPAGAEPIVLPAWPEVERVVEDCRG